MNKERKINTQFVVINTQNQVLRLYDGKKLLDKVQMDFPEDVTLEDTLEVIEEFRVQDSLDIRFQKQLTEMAHQHDMKRSLKALNVEREIASWAKYFIPSKTEPKTT